MIIFESLLTTLEVSVISTESLSSSENQLETETLPTISNINNVNHVQIRETLCIRDLGCSMVNEVRLLFKVSFGPLLKWARFRWVA